MSWFSKHTRTFLLLVLLVLALVAFYAQIRTVAQLRMESAMNLPAPVTHHQEKQSTKYGATTDVAMWQTYRNEVYGFSFKYPPYLSEEKDKEYPEIGDIITLAHQLSPGQVADWTFSLTLSKINKKISSVDSLQKYVTERYSENKYGGAMTSSGTVSGLEYVAVRNLPGIVDGSAELYFLAKGGVFVIFVDSDDERATAIFNSLKKI